MIGLLVKYINKFYKNNNNNHKKEDFKLGPTNLTIIVNFLSKRIL